MPSDKAKELKQRIQQQLTRLIEDAQTVRGSEHFREYLKIAAKFHRYSFGNAMLIAVQRPGATRVAGYRKWQDLGRQVRGGEKGIAILAPMPRYDERENPDTGEIEKVQTSIWFKVVHVFDVSQTDGDQLPELDWKGSGRDAAAEKALLDYAAELGIEARQYEYTGGAVGWSRGGEIGYTDAGNVPRTIAHELVHELTPDWHAADRGARESLTDAAAAIICYHFDIDIMANSANYIAGWSDDPKQLLQDLEKVQRVASTVIENVESRLQ